MSDHSCGFAAKRLAAGTFNVDKAWEREVFAPRIHPSTLPPSLRRSPKGRPNPGPPPDMSKLIWLAILATFACKAMLGKWPWQYPLATWLGLVRRHDPRAEARAQALLGVQPGATRMDIIEAHRQLIVAVHPDKGGTVDLVHEANAARDLLLARQARL